MGDVARARKVVGVLYNVLNSQLNEVNKGQGELTDEMVADFAAILDGTSNEVKSMANLKRLPFLYDIEILNDNPKVITGMELDHDLGDFYFIKDTITLKVSVKDIEKDVLIKNVYFDKLKQDKYERQQNVFRVVSWGLLIVGLVGFVIFIIVLLVVRKRH